MSRLVEVYQVSKLGPIKPCYVEGLIELHDVDFYLLEVNPAHSYVRDIRSRGGKLIDDLKRHKCRKVKFVWQGSIEGELLDSAFLEQTYYCGLCNEIHGSSDESAYAELANLSATDALSEMFKKYGVLSRRPRLARRA